MSKEDACFIHNGEIYYIVGAAERDIERYLENIVDFYETDEYQSLNLIRIKAQKYLIDRQIQLIMSKYCI